MSLVRIDSRRSTESTQPEHTVSLVRSGVSQTLAIVMCWLLIVSLASGLSAQDKFDPQAPPTGFAPAGGKGDSVDSPFGQQLGGFGAPGFGAPGFSAGPSVDYEASYEVEQGGARGRLTVKAFVGEGYHTYSTTQPAGGPLPTTIVVKDDWAKVVGPFVPDHNAHISEDVAWPGVPVEEYSGTVAWTAELQFAKKFEPESTQIAVQVDGLVCGAGSCVPVGDKVSAKFTSYYGEVRKVESLRIDNTHAEWSAQLEPATVAPGGTAVLKITANTDDGYHVYQFVPGDEETLYRTLMVAKTKSGLRFAEPTTDTETEALEGLDEPVIYYAAPVTWSIPIYVPEAAREGELPIEMQVGFLTCNDRSCDQPAGVSFTGSLIVSNDAADSGVAKLALQQIDYATVEDAPNRTTWIDKVDEQMLAKASGTEDERASETGLTLIHVLAGLAGGFILNFMPCVLPVIGLKVMSFVNQAGNSHRRVVTLNLAFVGGILAVMLVLAFATVAAKIVWGETFGWGEQFTVLEFKVVLAALVFAMALSFLGVWEIPIPGFATSSKSGELMEREGHWGAFLKGVLTTVLATPCSGPLLGSLFGLSLVLSPTAVVLLYLIVGLGMSLPYLLLCLSPGLVNRLPKPGPWMETLKQVLAFPLLLTAVFFVASVDDGHRIATLILLIVVWFACWMIGRVPAYAETKNKLFTWMSGGVVIALGAIISFTYFGPLHSDLPWVPYSEAQLAKYRQEGKTVMIDFTANWCLNCQINMRVAIDRPDVADLVAENDVIPMVADWTERSEEIRSKLDELQSNSIPILAIYPADPAQEPIILRDLLTESQVLKALEQAGPSMAKSKLTSFVE